MQRLLRHRRQWLLKRYLPIIILHEEMCLLHLLQAARSISFLVLGGHRPRILHAASWLPRTRLRLLRLTGRFHYACTWGRRLWRILNLRCFRFCLCLLTFLLWKAGLAVWWFNHCWLACLREWGFLFWSLKLVRWWRVHHSLWCDICR